MKKSYVISAIAAVIFLIATLTNPNQERHKEAVKNALKTSIQKAIKELPTEENKGLEQARQTLTTMLGDPFIDTVVNDSVSSGNYMFFSTTKFSFEGETKIIGIGAFGNVFIAKITPPKIEAE